MPLDLWDSGDCDAWEEALGQYEAAIRALDMKGLEELDRWYREELPLLVGERTPPYITREELVRVTKWKMRRGVWRERNMLLVEGNDPGVVRQTTEEAFAAVPDPRKPVAIISRLAGVGPATASAVLAAHSPEVYPFFDELVAAQMPGLGAVAFTAAYYAGEGRGGRTTVPRQRVARAGLEPGAVGYGGDEGRAQGCLGRRPSGTSGAGWSTCWPRTAATWRG